jgi:3-oxoacyl-[acyl-carrier protein] reductase
MTTKFGNKVVVITGAGSGMGRACAIEFAKEGAKIVASDINDAGGEETIKMVKSNKGDAIYLHADVANSSDAENLIKTAVKKYGKIDILLNVAGRPQRPVPVENMDDAFWDGIYDVNVKGVFHTVKYAVPFMKQNKSGNIVNVSSIGAFRPRGNSSCYSSSKAAVLNFTMAIALELAPFNIRANCVNPSGTDTPMAAQFAPEGANLEAVRKMQVAEIPLGRYIKPEEIAYAAMFLASEEAAMITGTYINVNAGRGI